MSNSLPKVGEIFEQRYELLEVLGEGGVGIVFKARQLESNRLIALKIIHPRNVVDEEWKQRFLREGQSLSRLENEHIVTVYHLGVAECGLLYLAMEYIRGKTLRKMLSENNRLEMSLAVSIAQQCCEALKNMHEQGIVHRDLKPENIVILDGPEFNFVKIIDFGLAHLERTEEEGGKLTKTGTLIGTATYMSPEQCRGAKVDRRSDIYSLTVVLYEMLTGQPPFTAESPIGMMYKHISESPPPMELHQVQGVAKSVNFFIAKGMSKSPETRFQTAEEMISALENLSVGPQAGRPLPSSLNRLSWIAIVLAIFVVSFSVLTNRRDSRTSPANILSKVSLHHRTVSIDSALRVEALLREADLHPGSKQGLAAAEEAMRLVAKSKRHGKYTDSLPERTALVLATFYYRFGRYGEAIKLFEKLDSITADQLTEELHWQDILCAKAKLANCYFALGQKERALAKAVELLRTDGGVRSGAGAEGVKLFLKLRKEKEARQLIDQAIDAECLISQSEICRKWNNPQLARYAIKRAKQIKEMESFVKYKNEIYLVELEEAYVDLSEHKVEQATEKLLALYANDWHKDLDRFKRPRFVRALAYVGELDKALAILNETDTRDDNESSVLKADLLVRQGKLKEASEAVESSMEIVDPESGSKRSAADRLKDVIAGKSDYRRGLNKEPLCD